MGPLMLRLCNFPKIVTSKKFLCLAFLYILCITFANAVTDPDKKANDMQKLFAKMGVNKLTTFNIQDYIEWLQFVKHVLKISGITKYGEDPPAQGPALTEYNNQSQAVAGFLLVAVGSTIFQMMQAYFMEHDENDGFGLLDHIDERFDIKSSGVQQARVSEHIYTFWF